MIPPEGENYIFVLDTETTTTDFNDPELGGPNGHIVELGAVRLNLKTGEITDVLHLYPRDPDASGNEWVYLHTDLQFKRPYYDAKAFVELELIYLFEQGPVTAFNLDFDKWMLGRDYPLACVKATWAPDIMVAADKIDEIPRKAHDTSSGWKSWPSVQSTLNYLFPNDCVVEKHRALQDARDEARILYELYLRGLYKVIE